MPGYGTSNTGSGVLSFRSRGIVLLSWSGEVSDCLVDDFIWQSWDSFFFHVLPHGFGFLTKSFSLRFGRLHPSLFSGGEFFLGDESRRAVRYHSHGSAYRVSQRQSKTLNKTVIRTARRRLLVIRSFHDGRSDTLTFGEETSERTFSVSR